MQSAQAKDFERHGGFKVMQYLSRGNGKGFDRVGTASQVPLILLSTAFQEEPEESHGRLPLGRMQ